MRRIVARAREGKWLVLFATVAVAAAFVPYPAGTLDARSAWSARSAWLARRAPTSGALRRDSLPTRLSDADFWSLVTTMSEPAGFFRSDNLVSNEVTFQHVIPELQRKVGAGGVYLGVGPDQNFTYITALEPRIAFIVDIRRGNLLQHLMYKALIELSSDRADFLSLLFSRPRPPGATADASVTALLAAYDSVAADSALFRHTLAAVQRRLVEEHRFTLERTDPPGIEYILLSFFDAGPALTYSFGRGAGGYGGYAMRGMPTYGELMVQTDADGVERGYLASEASFQRLRQMQLDNRIVPLVGDFGGPKALRAVGAYLRAREATASMLYTSNVEQYLFGSDDAWRRYYDNVAAIPTDERSTFIRAVFNYGNRDFGVRRGPRSVTMLSSVRELLAGVGGGAVQSYWDVVRLSRSPVEAAVR
ncbi:MAG: hypothetical protein IT359_15340 [Gemmatimonadaceae bacterium]|nr:hypothetical protein [Gemmatimonadaceae bacterium]